VDPLLASASIVFGLIFGSFLNVCIYRRRGFVGVEPSLVGVPRMQNRSPSMTTSGSELASFAWTLPPVQGADFSALPDGQILSVSLPGLPGTSVGPSPRLSIARSASCCSA
jgi:hypothetical protein